MGFILNIHKNRNILVNVARFTIAIFYETLLTSCKFDPWVDFFFYYFQNLWYLDVYNSAKTCPSVIISYVILVYARPHTPLFSLCKFTIFWTCVLLSCGDFLNKVNCISEKKFLWCVIDASLEKIWYKLDMKWVKVMDITNSCHFMFHKMFVTWNNIIFGRHETCYSKCFCLLALKVNMSLLIVDLALWAVRIDV